MDVKLTVLYGCQANLIRTYDVSALAKTGELLVKLVTEDIDYAEQKFGLTVIGWCSDDGGDARKMRRLLSAQRPWLIVILCWAHQVNLVVGDLFTLKLPMFRCIPDTIEIIKWFNNRSRAHGILGVEQRSINNGKQLTLVLPVITRWTAHFCSLKRLMEVEVAIRACRIKYGAMLELCAGEKAEAKAKAATILNIVGNDQFWTNVKRYVPQQTLYKFPLLIRGYLESKTFLNHLLLRQISPKDRQLALTMFSLHSAISIAYTQILISKSLSVMGFIEVSRNVGQKPIKMFSSRPLS